MTSMSENTSGILSSQLSLGLLLGSKTLEFGFAVDTSQPQKGPAPPRRTVLEVVNGIRMRGGQQQQQQLLTQWPWMEHLHKSEHL